jgi:hypothetical protein
LALLDGNASLEEGLKGEPMIAKSQIHAIAQQMLTKYGPKAIAQAGENALTCEQRGETDAANEWRHVKDAMKLMQGPHQS